jgi:hypothetical protein
MDHLRQMRPIFHSEADFQLAFGVALHDLAPDLNIRLEVRQQTAEYLDLLCFGPSGRTAIEFKYVTQPGPEPTPAPARTSASGHTPPTTWPGATSSPTSPAWKSSARPPRTASLDNGLALRLDLVS